MRRKGHDGKSAGWEGSRLPLLSTACCRRRDPCSHEGFSRIMSSNDDGVIKKKQFDLYDGLGPSDSLPSAVFG